MRQLGATVIEVADQNTDVAIVTERFERRLAEQCGKLRVEVSEVRVDMANGFAAQRAETAVLRAEMIDRNGELLKWILVFNATMIAAIAALMVLLR